MNYIKRIRKLIHRRDLHLGLGRVLRRTIGRDAFADQSWILGSDNVKTIFDVGANRGDTADQYHRLFSKANIYMFEPFPETFSKLNTRFSNASFAYIFDLAVGSQSGIKDFFITNSDFQHSLLQAHKTQKFDEDNRPISIEVKTTTLDDFCYKQAVNHINILKMDIQGGEYNSLVGANSLLERSAIDLIYTEAFVFESYKQQPLLHDIAKLLKNYGYYMFNWYNFSESNIGQVNQMDVIFTSGPVRQSLLENYGHYNTQYSPIVV